MGFQFSLASVLKVRGIQEEREERVLQQILFEISQTRDELVRTDQEIAQSSETRIADLQKPVLGLDIHASYGAIKLLKQYRKELQAQIEKLNELKEKQLKIYEAARRNREMLSEMEDTKRSVYDLEMARAEQRTLDDNFVARRGRF